MGLPSWYEQHHLLLNISHGAGDWTQGFVNASQVLYLQFHCRASTLTSFSTTPLWLSLQWASGTYKSWTNGSFIGGQRGAEWQGQVQRWGPLSRDKSQRHQYHAWRLQRLCSAGQAFRSPHGTGHSQTSYSFSLLLLIWTAKSHTGRLQWTCLKITTVHAKESEWRIMLPSHSIRYTANFRV